MWVYLDTWLVKDGQFPELARGSQLHGVGLRANCWAISPATGLADRLRELGGGDEASGRRCYELTGATGVVTDVQDGLGHAAWEFVITVPGQAFLARTTAPDPVAGAGARVTARCTLSVIADYEWEAFGLPDLRAGWQVRQLRVEHRQDRALADGQPGPVLRSREIGRPGHGDDSQDPHIRTSYLLDLIPSGHRGR